MIIPGHAVAQEGNFIYSNSFDDYLEDTLLVIGSHENNVWQIGNSSKTFFNTYELGMPPSIMTDTLNYYPIYSNSSFEITFGHTLFYFYHIFFLHFSHKYQTAMGRDGGFIEISYDKGKTWENIINDTVIFSIGHVEDSTNIYSRADTLTDGTPAYSGQSDSWIRSSLIWVLYDGNNPFNDDRDIDIKLKFTFRSDSIMDFMAGWIIDDIELQYSWFSAVEGNMLKFNSIVYPNPVTDASTLFLDNEMKEVHNIYIYNSSGSLVRSLFTTNGKISINAQDFHPGLYLYRIINSNTRKYSIGKFIRY